ncbi:hypothetical protein PRUB_b1477 [Pseudoalteromonas rubra]|uniref:DUF417 domain-containing protein n=1 Tax=Pseudoalteromonas rubra TaxID=43658 RepID=A0A8T0C2H5_9GAMM|nr:DUF417 family protein [Pseudoalteromonas rubra]KAF7782069.1 hypothetical protein PRUB_b1477 [Pseudoalteromonas rubra]
MPHSINFKLIAFVIAASLVVIGSSFMLGGHSGYVEKALGFYSLTDIYSLQNLGLFLGALFLVTGIMLASAPLLPSLRRPQFVLLIIVSVIMLLTLFDSSRWIAEHGGFPVIGSGQGIIKYFALLPLALYLCFGTRVDIRTHALINYIPVAIVLFWIGGMKFLELEAKAIVPLVETSPFMAWLYTLFSVQQASDLIGIYDLVFAIVLGLGVWFNKRLVMLVGLAGTGAVFVMTQTFLFTADGGFSSATVIDGLGLFIIKDLWFICNLLIILEYVKQPEQQV